MPRTAALCLTGQPRSFAYTWSNLTQHILRANSETQFDIVMVSAAEEADTRAGGGDPRKGNAFCREPNVRSCEWLLAPSDLPSLSLVDSFAASGSASAAAREKVRQAKDGHGHLLRGYSFANAMHKQHICWSEFHRRREHATDTHPFYYIGLRFDLELTGPLSLSQLDLKDNLYVGPHANQNTGPPAHRIATLRVSVPDFMVVADWERFTIWMTRGIAYELLYLPPPRSLRGSPGVPDRFPMLHAPEAFLARWLYLNGITHGQPSNNVSVLPGGASVLLVRPPGWPKADCEAPGRRWLAKCL